MGPAIHEMDPRIPDLRGIIYSIKSRRFILLNNLLKLRLALGRTLNAEESPQPQPI
jgi:hypothetical protein